MKILKRKKIIIITGILACIVFLSLIALEKKIVNSSPETYVVTVVKDIQQGQTIDRSYFIVKKKLVTDVTPDMIKSLDEVDGKYATENVYKGDILNKNRIADKNDSSRMFLKPNEREFSIPLNKLDNDAFAGTLRRGDIVDISHTEIASQGNPAPETELVGKNVRVLGAVDSQGKFLEKNDKNVVAASIMFAGSQDDFVNISNKACSGSFKIAKCGIQPK